MPRLYTDVNVTGTATLLEQARIFKVSRFLFGSSSSVYGNRQAGPLSETDRVEEPVSPYAATKRAGELLAYTYHHLYGMDMACLRFFTVYGPRQRPEMAIHKFTRLIDQGEVVPLFGDGSSARDYTYVEDIVDGIVAALQRSRGYEIFNLGRSEVVSLKELIGHIESALGKRAQVVFQSEQPGDVRATCANLEHSRSRLGYQPKVSVQDGIRRFVDWYWAQAAL
jgi:UDP-glucuronate 4-epimerase